MRKETKAGLFLIVHDQGRRNQKSFIASSIFNGFNLKKYLRLRSVFYEDIVPMNGDETDLNKIIEMYKSLGWDIETTIITG
jgi:hypothetical protein